MLRILLIIKKRKNMVSAKRVFKVLKGNNYDDLKILGGTIKFSSSLDNVESKKRYRLG